MVKIIGLTGLRASKEFIAQVTCPPYDVIKPGTELEQSLNLNPISLFHIILGPSPETALKQLIDSGALVEDKQPCFYVYEQTFNGECRTGVFVAAEVTDYSEGQIIRHEKTFDEKVKGRLELRKATGHSFGPVFLLTKSKIGEVLERLKQAEPEYEFDSEFGGETNLNGVHNRIFRVKEDSPKGTELKKLIGENPLYIADGHHRYHTSLKNKQSFFLAYICEDAKILAYNRVVNPPTNFQFVKERLKTKPVEGFQTPEKHRFRVYSKYGTFEIKAREVPDDPVGKLDCSILEKEVYPKLSLTHDMIMDERYFDYYPESSLATMKKLVDQGKFKIAIAMHPVSIEELMAVADAGLENPEIVMPEKSTFFAPKILTGIFILKHQ